MKTAAELVPARYVKSDRSMMPEPAYRRSWSDLRTLRWKASLIMSEHPGVRLFVFKGRSWTNGKFNYGLFSISYNSGGMSAMSFQSCHDILNGIDLGLSIASRLSDSTTTREF